MPKYVVRCGSTRSLGVFGTTQGAAYRRGARVITRTDRGLEVGEVLCEATDAAVGFLEEPTRGQVLRTMTGDDENELVRMHAQEKAEFESCRKQIAELQLPMELVDVEHVFGGERIVFYYLAENRVDFRDLVKILASEFQTRIEMRQIGVRDEAKLLADYGDCGKPVCCNTHLTKMPPVSMRMAKLQKATLDPTKISGRCGRLKCCLRYEFDTYEELQKELPPVGAHVISGKGRGRVLAQEILAGQVLLEMEDHRRILVTLPEILQVLPRNSGGGGNSGGSHSGGRNSDGGNSGPERHDSPEEDA